MAGRLVTIARFDLAGQAHIARNALDAAGIKAVITDEAIVAMDWLLSNAVGGIKVQVLEEDADRALAALEQVLGSDEPDEPVDEEALAAEAEAAGIEEDYKRTDPQPTESSPTAPVTKIESVVGGGEHSPPERDEYARRLLLAAFFGLVVPLLWFYAVYLFLNAVFGQGTLSPRGRNQLLIGSFLLLLGSVMAFFLIQLYGDPFP